MLKVSIIIPVYRVEQYIEDCLRSSVKGSLIDREIIIVDDGSPDDSITKAKIFADKYPESIRIVEKCNGGLSSARNFGIPLAKGEYLIFVDSDDIINADVIDEMIKNADENNSDIVVADYFEFHEGLSKTVPRYDKSKFTTPLITEFERLDKLFTIDVSFAVWNKLYRRSFIEKHTLFFLEGFWFEDLDFVFRTFYQANRITKVDKLFYGYRQRESSIMKTLDLRTFDKIDIMDQLRGFLEKENKFHLYKNGYDLLYIRMFLSVLFVCLINNDPQNVASKIVNRCFSADYLPDLIHSRLIRKNELKLKERLAFNLIRFRIFNKVTAAFGLQLARKIAFIFIK